MPSLPDKTPSGAVFGSWKEIASFLGKGVRTVQRWERDLALPVHRPPGRHHGVVIAFPEELTTWAKRQYHAGNAAGLNHDQIERMHELRSAMLSRAAKLHANAQQMAMMASTIVERLHKMNGRKKKEKASSTAHG